MAAKTPFIDAAMVSELGAKLQESHLKPAPLSRDASAQTAAMYSSDADGSVTLTFSEAERLWSHKHQALLHEFQGILSSQAEYYEEQFSEATGHMNEL